VQNASALRVAAVQMDSSADRAANLRTAEALVRRAAADGARLVVLPEKWPYIHGPRLLEGWTGRR
jgi:predicted amidohydrolase